VRESLLFFHKMPEYHRVVQQDNAFLVISIENTADPKFSSVTVVSIICERLLQQFHKNSKARLYASLLLVELYKSYVVEDKFVFECVDLLQSLKARDTISLIENKLEDRLPFNERSVSNGPSSWSCTIS